MPRTDPKRWEALKRDLGIAPPKATKMPKGYENFIAIASAQGKILEVIISNKVVKQSKFLGMLPPAGFRKLTKEDGCFMWRWDKAFRDRLDKCGIWTGDRRPALRGFYSIDEMGVPHKVDREEFQNLPDEQRVYDDRLDEACVIALCGDYLMRVNRFMIHTGFDTDLYQAAFVKDGD